MNEEKTQVKMETIKNVEIKIINLKFNSMKKVNIILILLGITLVAVFNSCTKNPNDLPIVPAADSNIENVAKVASTDDGASFELIEAIIEPAQRVLIKSNSFHKKTVLFATNESDSGLEIFITETPASNIKVIQPATEEVIIADEIGGDGTYQSVYVKNPSSTQQAKVKVKIYTDPYEYIKVSNFEEYGISHNKTLDEIAHLCNIATSTRQERYQISASIIFAGKPNNEIPSWDDINQKIGYTKSLNPSNAANKLFQDNQISENEKALVSELSVILNNLENPNSVNYTPEQFSSVIKSLEIKILNTCKIIYDPKTKEGNSAAKLLGACAIARYSYQYWYKAAIEFNNPWHALYDVDNGTGGNNVPKCNIWRWIKRTACDVWGFISAGECLGVGSGGVTYNIDCAYNNAVAASAAA